MENIEKLLAEIKGRREERVSRFDFEWNESLHKRAKNGQFAKMSGGGESAKDKDKTSTSKKPSNSAKSDTGSSASGATIKGSVSGADKKGVAYNAPSAIKKEYAYKNSRTSQDVEKIGKGLRNGFGKTDTFDNDGDDTLKLYTDANGNLDPQRNEIHKDIICNHLSGVNKPKGTPVFTFMGGGPASGKGTIQYDPKTNPNGIRVPQNSTHDGIKVDSDEIKKVLPEYKQMTAEGNDRSAGYVHEESSALTKRIIGVGTENGYNVTLDGTGDGSVNGMLKKIRQAREAGMKVEGHYVTCSIDEALDRNLQRFLNTGRYPDPEMLIETHRKVSDIFPQIYKEFDHIDLYDTEGDNEMIASADNGVLTIHNKEKYQKFLDKKSYDKPLLKKYIKPKR